MLDKSVVCFVEHNERFALSFSRGLSLETLHDALTLFLLQDH